VGTQLQSSNIAHFPALGMRKQADTNEDAEEIQILQQEFNSLFKIFIKHVSAFGFQHHLMLLSKLFQTIFNWIL
jgi:hypothetical protein